MPPFFDFGICCSGWVGLAALGLHFRHESRVRVGGQDPCELCPVVQYEARPIDDDVTHLPPITPTDHPIVDGKLLAGPGQQRGLDACGLAVEAAKPSARTPRALWEASRTPAERAADRHLLRLRAFAWAGSGSRFPWARRGTARLFRLTSPSTRRRSRPSSRPSRDRRRRRESGRPAWARSRDPSLRRAGGRSQYLLDSKPRDWRSPLSSGRQGR
jgi:hypothetical protein